MSESTQSQRCGKCGASLSTYAPEGLCASCLLESAFEEGESATGETAETKPLLAFNDYELLEEVARGGMGVVYRARQISLNRTVAIKMILGGHLANAAELQRFRAEAETAAQLQHPNIVSIHEVGEHAGQPFFSMDLVEGRNVAQLVRDEPLPSRKAAAYLKTIAEAVQYAHSRGVLHRDLKPSNILIDENDQPRVTDFGLAKRLGDSQLTQTGQVLGSPSFIPPEQAAGQKSAISPVSDVYSMGAILYHCLTARPPFVAETLPQTLRLVAEQEPVSPRLLNASVPRDLETICLKCLEKQPDRRYASARELSEELARFLRDEPIRARPVDQAEKVWRWCRRKPATASLLGALLLVGAGGLAGILWQWRRAEDEAAQARISAEKAQAQTRIATEQESLARRRYYAAQINLANQAWETGQIPRTLDLLETQRPQPGQADLRGFEWFHLWGLCNERNRLTFRKHSLGLVRIAFSPDGKTVASGDVAGNIRLWDPSDGRELAVLKDGSGLVDSLAFTPDGRTLVSGHWDHFIRLWDLGTGEHKTLTGHPYQVRCVAVSPDGKTLASCGDGGTAKLWDLATGKERTSLPGHQGAVIFVAFSPDNTMVAFLSGWGEPEGGFVILCSLTYGVPQFKWKVAIPGDAVAFSPDSRTLAIAGWDSVALLDTGSGRKIADLRGHLPEVTSVAFLPDGSVASGGSDRTVRVWPWDADSGTFAPDRVIGTHPDTVLSVAASPNGVLLASGANDGSVKLWSLATPESSVTAEFKLGVGQLSANLGSLLRAPREDVMFLTTQFGTEVRDIVTTRRISYWPDAVGTGSVSPDGRHYTTGSKDGLIKLWEVKSGRLLASAQHVVRPADKLHRIALSPDGRMLATATFEHPTVSVWDTQNDLKLIHKLRPPSGVGITALQFTPDSKGLVVAVRHAEICYFDVASGLLKERVPYGNGAVSAWSIAFSPDGKLMATSGDIAPILWDAESKRPLFSLKGHVGTVNTIEFSPDGGTVATGGIDSTIRLWDVVTGQELITFNQEKAVDFVAFSADGTTLLAANKGGTVWLRCGYRLPEADHEGSTQTTSALPNATDCKNLAWAIVRKPGTVQRAGYGLALALEAVRFEPTNVDCVTTLGVAYLRNGETERAIETLLRSGQLNSGGLIATDMFFLSMAHHRLGRTTEARDYYNRSLKWMEAHSSKLSTDKIEELASFRVEAEIALNIAPPESRENLLAGNQPMTADSPWDLYHQASLLRQQGKPKEAEAVFNTALEAMKNRFEDRGVTVTLNTLANMLAKEGRLPEAEKLHREAAIVARKLPAGPEHDEFLEWSLGDLAQALQQQGKLEEAETRYREALEISISFSPDTRNKTAVNVAGLLDIFRITGRFGDAEKLFNEVLTPAVSKWPQNAGLLQLRSVALAQLRRNIGWQHSLQNRWPEAVTNFAMLMRLHELAPVGLPGPDTWGDSASLDCLLYGPALIELGDVAAYKSFRQALVAHNTHATNSVIAERTCKVSLLLPADDELLKALMPLYDVAARRQEDPGWEGEKKSWASVSLALVDYRRGQYSKAVRWCSSCILSSQQNPVRTATAQAILAMSYHHLGQQAEARATLAKAASTIEEAFRPRGSAYTNGPEIAYFDWIFARIVLRETQTLVRPAGAPGTDAKGD